MGLATTPTLVIDILEGVRWLEENGVVKEVSRVAVVSNILATYGQQGDFGTIGEGVIVIALNHADMPQPGDPHPLLSHLFVVDRFPIARSTRIIQVEIRYKIPGGIDPPPPGQPWTLSGGASLEEIETQVDRNGNQITVTHGGKTQGGVIRPLMPRRELNARWTGQSVFPGDLVDAYAGKTNLSLWQGGLQGTWLCLDIDFDIADPDQTPPLYEYNAHFRHKDDNDGAGHDPQVVYIDPETGQPPPGLVEGEGYKIILWYFQAEFNALP